MRVCLLENPIRQKFVKNNFLKNIINEYRRLFFHVVGDMAIDLHSHFYIMAEKIGGGFKVYTV